MHEGCKVPFRCVQIRAHDYNFPLVNFIQFPNMAQKRCILGIALQSLIEILRHVYMKEP